MSASEEDFRAQAAHKIKRQWAVLEEMTQREIPQQDQRQLVDRWNDYMGVLDLIADEIKDLVGVTLEKNLKSNIQQVADESNGVGLAGIVGIVTAIMIGLVVTNVVMMPVLETNLSDGSIPPQVGSFISFLFIIMPPLLVLGIVFAFIVMMSGFRIRRKTPTTEQLIEKQPQIITLSVKPVLHIDELAFAHQIIHGMPQISNDPEIYLPELSLEVTREWLAKESTLITMDRLGKIELPKSLNRNKRP